MMNIQEVIWLSEINTVELSCCNVPGKWGMQLWNVFLLLKYHFTDLMQMNNGSVSFLQESTCQI
jgi:hypothetical protein